MKQERILLIEDEPMLARNIELYLKNQGYLIDVSYTEANSLDLLQQNVYDAAIIDIMLPDGDGWSIIRHIKKNYPETIVLITSARRSEEDKVFGFELGADDYITKPIGLKELHARLQLRLQSMSNTQPIPLQYAHSLKNERFSVNIKSHIITEDGVAIHFKPKEFDLIAFLIEHPDQVFTRDDLLGAVWGYDFDGDERTVDSHVKKIRAKSDFLKEHLSTIWGVGYKLSSQGEDADAQ